MTGDELVTDAFTINEVDDFFYEVDGVMITEGGEDIDIGGNAAEGEEEEGSEAVKICNVVSSGRFQQTQFGKKDYVAIYKAYMKVRPRPRPPLRPAACCLTCPWSRPASQKVVKHLKQSNPDRVDAFKTVSVAQPLLDPSQPLPRFSRTRMPPLNSVRRLHRLPRVPSRRSLACGMSSNSTWARARRRSKARSSSASGRRAPRRRRSGSSRTASRRRSAKRLRAHGARA